MDRATFVSHQPFAGEKKPSMLRRRVGHDYQSRCIYLLTLTVEGRQPLLGTLHGLEETDTPYVELTPLGRCIREEWVAVSQHHPEVSSMALQVMPDHLHGILFVREPMSQHLSMIIKGFKARCNQHYRRLFHIPLPSEGTVSAIMSPYAATPSQQRKPDLRGPQRNNDDWETRDNNQGSRGENRSKGLLWSHGYNDHILEGRGELDRWFAYLQDNPRRLAIRRAHPDYFRVRFGVRVGGQEFAAIGNRFLLDYPDKRQVQLTRSLSETQIEAEVQKHLLLAQRGSVLVSPAISRGEQAVMRAVLDARLPLIFLTPWGFNEFSKPGHQYFEACADGRFLILAPWPHENQRIALSREMCLTLNNMTNNICNQTSEYGFN